MKKIKIITRHAVANYGSILQAYATQQVIEKLGHESEIINYVRNDEKGKEISNTMLKRNKKWNKNFITRFIYKTLQTHVYDNSYKKFEGFRKEFLKETQRVYSSSEELKELPEADIYCTGSDQVWGSIGNDCYDKNYFLDFVPDGKKCISYAGSFGKNQITEDMKKTFKEFFKKYDYITVREDSAKAFLADMGLESDQVVDPTLLLTKEEWSEVLENKLTKDEFVLIYQLHKNKKLESYAKEFAKKVHKPLIRISISWLYKFKSGKLICLPTPNRFLEYFKKCEYVITDSFHATVFALIFNKKLVVLLPEGTSSRILSLLKLLKLEDRVVYDYNDFSLSKKDIDYNLVNKKMAEERKKSIDILKRMIGE